MHYSEFRNLSLDNFLCKRALHESQGYIAINFELPAVDNLVDLIGGRIATKQKVRKMLDSYLYDIKTCGILSRLQFDPISYKWSYCAAQDCASELAYIRKHILKSY